MSDYLLFQYKLLSLGNIILLNDKCMVHPSEVKKTILSYQKYFKPYNPRKTQYNRYGLSITSKDGGLSGIPELDSLYEYNQLNGTNFDEPDFREWTPFFKDCIPLQKTLSPFHNYMGPLQYFKIGQGRLFSTP